MAYNKALYNNNTIFDLTQDTVNENNLLSGETAHDNQNEAITGSLVPVLTVNGKEPDAQGDVEVGSVRTVNSTPPDTQGNVDIVALPSGGTTNQVLTKRSSTDGDAIWKTMESLPSGGTQGQIIVKQSSTDGDADWEDTNYMTVDELAVYQGATPINADLLDGNTRQQIISSAVSQAVSQATLEVEDLSSDLSIQNPTISTNMSLHKGYRYGNVVVVQVQLNIYCTSSTPLNALTSYSVDLIGAPKPLVVAYNPWTTSNKKVLVRLEPDGKLYVTNWDTSAITQTIYPNLSVCYITNE